MSSAAVVIGALRLTFSRMQANLIDILNRGISKPFKNLHGPPMLVDKINFGLVFYNHVNFYRFEDASSYWSVKVVIITNLEQKQKSA